MQIPQRPDSQTVHPLSLKMTFATAIYTPEMVSSTMGSSTKTPVPSLNQSSRSRLYTHISMPAICPSHIFKLTRYRTAQLFICLRHIRDHRVYLPPNTLSTRAISYHTSTCSLYKNRIIPTSIICLRSFTVQTINFFPALLHSLLNL